MSAASGLTAVSQLVARHAEAIARPDLLLVNPPADDLPRELAAAGGSGWLLNQRYGEHRHHRQRQADGFEAAFGTLPAPAAGCAQAVLFVDREKALLELMIQATAACLRPGGTLWLVGENRAGGKSAGRRLAAVTNDWQKLDAARHCSLHRAGVADPPAPPVLRDWAACWQAELGGHAATLVSLPGVFSHGELDPATRMLLEHLPPIQGSVLDYGCGSGVIGLHAALAGAEAVSLLDHSALALESARLTFQANELPSPALIASDGFSDLMGRHDLIVSNPPFHRGAATDYRAAEILIDQAGDHLVHGGQLLIVANAFLDYGQRMQQRYGNCTVLAADGRFRVYLSRR